MRSVCRQAMATCDVIALRSSRVDIERRRAGRMHAFAAHAARKRMRFCLLPKHFMNLESFLFSQGFGSRRQCRALVADGRVAIDGTVLADADAQFTAAALVFEVDGTPWP